MPNKHFYFAMGALHGAAVVVWVHSQQHAWFQRYRWVRQLYRRHPDWHLYFPTVIVTFGFLALVPDTLYALGILSKSAIRSDLFNVFYGYAWFEHVEDSSPRLDWLFNTLGSGLLYALSLAVLGFYVRLLSAEQDGQRALQDPSRSCR